MDSNLGAGRSIGQTMDRLQLNSLHEDIISEGRQGDFSGASIRCWLSG